MSTSPPHHHSVRAPDDATESVVEGDRYGRLVRLHPEYRERYIILHEHPFPEVLDRIHRANLRNYSIFLKEGWLFSFFEYVGTDYEADMAGMAQNDTVQDWWTLTDPMQESVLPDEAEAWWATMDELYHGGSKEVPSPTADKHAYVRRLADAELDVAPMFDEVADALDEALAASPFQNYSVYRWGPRLYTYFEYAGDQFDADHGRLRESEGFRALHETLDPLTDDGDAAVVPMEPVFYLA